MIQKRLIFHKGLKLVLNIKKSQKVIDKVTKVTLKEVI